MSETVSGVVRAEGEAPRLALREVSRKYGRRWALHPVSLELVPGRIVGVVGPNGAGKTTLLGIALGLLRPTTGRVERHEQLAARGGAGVGALLERDGLLPGMTAEATLLRWAPLVGVTGRDRVERVLADVGLGDAAGVPVRSYSQGMRRRLALARALLGGPDVLVLDEPGNGLDPRGVLALHALLRREAAAGAAVVLSSHSLVDVDELCDEVVYLDGGRIDERWDATASRWWRFTLGPEWVEAAGSALADAGIQAEPDEPGPGLLVRQEQSLQVVIRLLGAAGVEIGSVTDLGRHLWRPFQNSGGSWGR